MEQIIALTLVAAMAWSLRWKWDVPRGTFSEADFQEKKNLYEKEEQEDAERSMQQEKIQKKATSEPSSEKIRISAGMVERVKIGDKWYDVVDANFFEVTNQ